MKYLEIEATCIFITVFIHELTLYMLLLELVFKETLK